MRGCRVIVAVGGLGYCPVSLAHKPLYQKIRVRSAHVCRVDCMSSQQGFGPLKNAWAEDKERPKGGIVGLQNPRRAGRVSQRKQKQKRIGSPTRPEFTLFLSPRRF